MRSKYFEKIVYDKEQLVVEICALKKLKHCNNIVQLLFAVLPNKMYLERMDLSLANLIDYADEPLETLFSGIVCQIIAGLNQCAIVGIIHGDLKPANVLINLQSGVLKLCDFGSAKSLLTPTKSCLGTRWYKSFEQLMGAKTVSPAIDIWALGCIAVELEWLCPMFPGRSDIHQLALIHAALGPIHDWPEAESELEAFGKVCFANMKKTISFGNCQSKFFVDSCLILNPKKRIHISKLIKLEWNQETFGQKLNDIVNTSSY